MPISSAHPRLIAIDLDGTLLTSDKKLTRRSRNAIETCIARGDQVVMASGRPFSSLPEEVMAIPGLAYAITSNGAALFDCRSKVRCLHNCLSPESALQILTLLQHRDDLQQKDDLQQQNNPQPAAIEVIIDGTPYTFTDFVRDPRRYGVTESGVSYIQQTRRPVADIYAFAAEHSRELEAIDIITPSPEEKTERLAQLSSVPGLYITSSIAHLIEISSSNCGKGPSLRHLAEEMGYPRSRVIAFGNEENDIDMLLYAGAGVAVANSSPAVLAIADQITADNNADGVAIVLEQLEVL